MSRVKLTTVMPRGTVSMMMNSTYGIEPSNDKFYSKKIEKTVTMGRKKQWSPSHGAQVGDVTSFGVIVELSQSSWNSETVAKFDRGHGPANDRFTRGMSDDILNWTRLERVLHQIINDRKKGNRKPVFRSMVRNLALLWECTIDQAFDKVANVSELEEALEKSKVKQKTIARQGVADLKFGL